jgi:hypothetical protein
MKKSSVVVSGLLGLSLWASAEAVRADDGGYVGASYLAMAYKEDGLSDAKLGAIAVRLGRTLSKNIAVEARVGKGIKDDTLVVLGIPVEVEVKNFFGFYLRGTAPLTPQLSVYGLVGYTQGKVSASFSGFKNSETDGDASYGVGADFAVNKNVVINAEVAKYFSGDGYEVTGAGVGVAFYY